MRLLSSAYEGSPTWRSPFDYPCVFASCSLVEKIDVRASIDPVTQKSPFHASFTNRTFFRAGRAFFDPWSEGRSLSVKFNRKIIQRKDCVAQGNLCGNSIDALADTCAGNFITEEFLRGASIDFQRKKGRMITVGDGKKAFATLGSITLPWTFRGEESAHLVEFDVIPSHCCDYAITLGGRFLSSTGTLAEHFGRRIVRRLRTGRRPRLFYQGNSHVRVKGYCNGVRVAALADTCSDVDLLSPEMLEELGYDSSDILTDERHCIFLQLPGGRITKTSGMIPNVEFRFGDGLAKDSYTRDFYILPGLPAGILLGDDFLIESDAFHNYSEHLFDFETAEEEIPEGLFLNIKWVERARKFFSGSSNTGSNTPYSVELIAWNLQCTVVLNKIEAVHSTSASSQDKIEEILRLEEEYRQLQRRKPKRPDRTGAGDQRPP